MRICTRRSVLSALGITLPFGLAARPNAHASPAETTPVLRFLPFEEAVRAAFAECDRNARDVVIVHDRPLPYRRVEVGHSELIRAGVQGCHNDRPFAGFPAGHLRIVRAGSEPGPVWLGVRLHVATLDVALTGGPTPGLPSRPLDFAALPPAPMLAR